MKKISRLIVMVIMVLAVPMAVSASPPSIPLLVYGDVTIDDQPAPVGTEILAEINNIEISTVVAKEGKYFIEIPDGKSNEGKMITFKVIGITDDANQLECVNASTIPSINFDLSVSNIESEPTTPAPSSGGGGGGGGGAGVPSVPLVEDEDNQEMPKIPVIKGVSDVTVLDGDIIQCASSSNPFAVYIVKIVGDTKYIRHIVSLEIFNYYGHLRWENLKQVGSLSDYSLSGWVRHNTGPNGTAGPTDKVYEINGDQTKHWINMTAEDFLSHGGSEPAIYSVNQGELDLYATGADVMSL